MEEIKQEESIDMHMNTIGSLPMINNRLNQNYMSNTGLQQSAYYQNNDT